MSDSDRAALARWHRSAKRALGSNDRFVKEESAGFTIFRQNTATAERALKVLLPDPDEVFNDARILKQGSRTHAAIVDIQGTQYVLKRYNCRGLLYRIGNAFRRSRALRTWFVTWEYCVRTLPVPSPLICLEERRFRLLGRSYILMEYADGAKTLREAWNDAGEKEKELLLDLYAAQLGTLHRRGILHGDLKWDNLLIGSDSETRVPCIVDFDGSKALARASFCRSRKDISRFLSDLKKEGGGSHCERFIRSWERVFVNSLPRGDSDR